MQVNSAPARQIYILLAKCICFTFWRGPRRIFYFFPGDPVLQNTPGAERLHTAGELRQGENLGWGKPISRPGEAVEGRLPAHCPQEGCDLRGTKRRTEPCPQSSPDRARRPVSPPSPGQDTLRSSRGRAQEAEA